MRAEALMHVSRPAHPDFHFIESGAGYHVLVVDRSRFYDLDASAFEALRAVVSHGGGNVAEVMIGLGGAKARTYDDPIPEPAIHALSLAVAQKCNLGCTYCYARQGSFGVAPRNMRLDVALQAVDLLLAGKKPRDRVNLAFMGGEPLVNRSVLRETVLYGAREAEKRGVLLGFSITTNGTLVRETDAEFFEEHGFAVTVSLDGPQSLHDRLRPFNNGRGSFDAVRRAIDLLVERQRRMQVSARVTVTPQHDDLPRILEEFIAMGFHSVGFSPMLKAPSGRGEMTRDDLGRMLEGMVECGMACERRSVAGERYPFANLLQALREIHRGTHRPYPCGAGAGYLGVSATGELAACHRFVEDERGALGSLGSGVDVARQQDWLRDRHVHRQSPCNACWARYLCSGGCHHENIDRERSACDYIRGWLHYCFGAYARLSVATPSLFNDFQSSSS